MSEQATNSPAASAEATTEQALTDYFGGGADPKGGQPSNRPRDETGRFAPQGRQEEPQQNQDTAQAEAPGTEEPGQEQAQAQSEEVEVEFDFGPQGKKAYRVPKEISDRFIQHEDYTRKTQSIAEMRRVLSSQQEAVGVEQAFSQATATERQQLALLDAQIAQFQSVNWGQLETEQLLRTRAQLDQLKDMRSQVDSSIKGKRADFDNRVKGLRQEAITAGAKYVQQHIKGFDDKQQQALMQYGLGEGYTRDELGNILDPRIVVSLWKASQWDALQASKPGVTNRAQQAAPVVRPGAKTQSVSRVQQLQKAAANAKDGKAKQVAIEELLAFRLGGGR